MSNARESLHQPLFLVTGGAGFLGINLIRVLRSRGCAVRSLDIAAFDYPEKLAIDVMQADIRDARAVDRAMNGVDMVVHCGAALPRSSREDIYTTDVEGTRLLLRSAARHRVERFIYISSTSVYGVPDHHPIVETDPVRGVGPYGEAKIEAERCCALERERGLCVPILRPKSFVGPERLGVFELLYEWACCGRNFPVLGAGNNLYQLLDVSDLCEAIVLCATQPRELVDDSFNVGAREFGTMRDNVQAVLDRAGHGKRVISLPAGAAIATLRFLEHLHLSPLYRWIYETAAQDSFVSIDRLESRLKFLPRYSNRAALIRNYDWYLEHRAEYRGKTGLTHRLPWKKGALEFAKWMF